MISTCLRPSRHRALPLPGIQIPPKRNPHTSPGGLNTWKRGSKSFENRILGPPWPPQGDPNPSKITLWDSPGLPMGHPWGPRGKKETKKWYIDRSIWVHFDARLGPFACFLGSQKSRKVMQEITPGSPIRYQITKISDSRSQIANLQALETLHWCPEGTVADQLL